MKNLLLLALVGFSLTSTAQASLVARAGGMVYDDVNNITWASDANLFQTQAASNPNLVSEIIAANGGVIHDTPNTLDTVPNSGTYSLTSADFDSITGKMTWWGAQAWANSLALGGLSGWTLPTTADAAIPVDPVSPINAGYNITSSQMGNLFYTQLGGVANTSIMSTHNTNYDLFSKVLSNVYWSNSEFGPGSSDAWYFGTFGGFQQHGNKADLYYAWAVHNGDVSVAAVPLPGAVWLFLSGLIGLMSVKRHTKRV